MNKVDLGQFSKNIIHMADSNPVTSCCQMIEQS